jgi:hypothetical protein
MAGAIYIPNLAQVLAGIEATEEQIDFAAKFAISMAGYEVERLAKKTLMGLRTKEERRVFLRLALIQLRVT